MGEQIAGLEEELFDKSEDLFLSQENEVQKQQKKNKKHQRQAVWSDPQDQDLNINVSDHKRLRKLRQREQEDAINVQEYQNRLKKVHAALNQKQKWADLDSIDPERDGDDSFWREALPLTSQSSSLLPPHRIQLSRMKDANQEERAQAVIKSLQFHSNGQLLLTAGLDKKLRLFAVDGVQNSKVQSVYFGDMPIQQASFCCNGDKILATGRRKFFYLYDMYSQKIERVGNLFGREEKSFESFIAPQQCTQQSYNQQNSISYDDNGNSDNGSNQSLNSDVIAFIGNDGNIPLFSSKSRTIIGNLKMNSTVRTGAFSRDGQQLLTSGTDGQVYVWDLRAQKCLYKFVDEGCVKSTALQIGPQLNNGNLLCASGQSSGVVNLYSLPQQNFLQDSAYMSKVAVPQPQKPQIVKPLKYFMNQTTQVDSLEFSADGQILAIASRMKKNALSLIHIPSQTVFQNWPTSSTPLNFVSKVAFSPGGGFMTIANAKGQVLLYRLHHYQDL